MMTNGYYRAGAGECEQEIMGSLLQRANFTVVLTNMTEVEQHS